MLYDSYEQVVARDRPFYWWRPSSANNSPGWFSQGQPGESVAVTSNATGAFAGPGIPGAASGVSSDCIGTAQSNQGWSSSAHTMPNASPANGVSYEVWLMPLFRPVSSRFYNVFMRATQGFFTLDDDLCFTPDAYGTQLRLSDCLRVGTWTHTVGIARNANHELWVNGSRSYDFRTGLPSLSANDVSGSLSESIGLAGKDNAYSFFGLVAEPAIYNYALSPSQILDHYRAGITPVRKSGWTPLAAYPFTAAPPPPPPGGLTAITEGLPNRRVLLVSDRPR